MLANACMETTDIQPDAVPPPSILSIKRDGFEALQIAHLGEQVPVMDVLLIWRPRSPALMGFGIPLLRHGIAAHQSLAGRRCLQILRLQEAPWIAAALPALDQFHMCTSTSRCILPIAWWFKVAYSTEKGAPTLDADAETDPQPRGPKSRSASGALATRSHAASASAPRLFVPATWPAATANMQRRFPIASRLWGLPATR